MKTIARRVTWGVIILQSALLLTMAVTPTWIPPRVKMFELIWAAMREPIFYPLIAVFTFGPGMTLTAWIVPGRHRAVLAIAWSVFLVAVMSLYGDRVGVMMRVLWWEYGE